MKLLKRLFKGLVALVLVVVVVAVALVFLLDPNIFKPRLEALAQDQGLELNIDGNLGWQLWPNLGLEVRDIRLATVADPHTSLMNLERASLRVQTWPLLSGRLQVHEILLQAPSLNLIVNEQGRGNWETLTSDPTSQANGSEASGTGPEASATEAQAPQAAGASGSALELAVERISLQNATLNYRDMVSGQSLTLAPLNLNVAGFNLQGEPFELTLGWQAQISNPDWGAEPLTISGRVSGRTILAQDFEHLQLEQGQLGLDLSRAGASDSIQLDLGLRAEQLLSEPTYSGQLSLAPVNLKKMMQLLSLPAVDTQRPEALTRLGLDVDFKGTHTGLTLDPVRLTLDNTQIKGVVAVNDFESQALRVDLTGNQLNLDDYLPPAPAEETEPEPTDGDQELIPLDVVRDLDLDLRVGFEALTMNGLKARDIELRVLAENGLVTLEQARLQAYEGSLEVDGTLDARGQTAATDFSAQLNGLELAPLLSDLELDQDMQLTGALNADLKGEARGVTMNQLMDSLTAETNFSGAQVRLAPLNIEQQFCQIVRLASRVESDPNPVSSQVWPDYTQLTELSGQAVVQNQLVNLKDVRAGVERLSLGVQGQVDLQQALVDLTLPLSLGSESTSEQGCQVPSNYWINRSLSLLRCRGSLDAFNPAKDCRPDKEGLAQLAQDYARFRLEDKAKGKVEEKTGKLKEKAREKLGEDAVEGLKKLFGR